MNDFEDPNGRGRMAIIAVLVWLAADCIYTIGGAFTILALGDAGPGVAPETADAVSGFGGIAMLVTLIVSAVFVGRWIMRVNRNAHSLAPEWMTISPGWNVGWFFIPVATLWKPFQGLRETWQASHSPMDPASAPVPMVMRWWWGLWLLTNGLGNVSTRLTWNGATRESLIASSWIDVVTFAIDIALTYSLITMIRRFNALQTRGPDYAETFA